MNIFSKFFFSLLIILTSSSLVLSEEPLSIRLGFVAPLTGPVASWGVECREGAELALEKIPPSLQSRLVLLFQDYRHESKEAVAAFNALKMQQGANVFVVSGAPGVGPIAPIAERDHTLLFALASSEDFTNYKSVVRVFVSAEQEVDELIRYFQKKGIRRIATVTGPHAAMVAAETLLARRFPLVGGEIVKAEQLGESDKDGEVIVSRVFQKKPEAVVVLAMPPQSGAFTRKARQLGRKESFFALVNAEMPDEVIASAGSMEGLIYTGPDAGPNYIEQFVQRYGHEPAGVSPATCYATVLIVAEALGSGAANIEDLRKIIGRDSGFETPLGKVTLDGSNSFFLPTRLKQIKHDKFVNLE